MYTGYNGNNDLREFLQPYSKEEMQEMVMQLADADHAIYQIVMNRLSTDTKWCKLFVHGLHPNTTKQSLARAFQPYGNLKEAVVLLEQHDRSKGCGFVVYEHSGSAHHALSSSVIVDGRRVQCDYAWKGNPKKMALLTQPVISAEQRLAADGRRLFIHDLAWKTSNDTLRRAFQQYGTIQEAVVIHDRQTGKSKGFGFVTFTSSDAAVAALREPEKYIDGRKAKVAYAKATKDAPVPTSTATPPYRQSPSPDSVHSAHSGRYSPNEANQVTNFEKAKPAMLKRPSLNLVDVSGGSNTSSGSLPSLVSNNSYPPSMSSVPSYSMANSVNSAAVSMPMFTPNGSNQWAQVGFPNTQLQGGISSESAILTPAQTPLLLPVGSTTPPVMSLQMQNLMCMQSMHPSTLPPPPSPNSLGIRTSPPNPELPKEYGTFLALPVGMLPNVCTSKLIMQQPRMSAPVQPQPVEQK